MEQLRGRDVFFYHWICIIEKEVVLLQSNVDSVRVHNITENQTQDEI